jgi:hypothetical protein
MPETKQEGKAAKPPADQQQLQEKANTFANTLRYSVRELRGGMNQSDIDAVLRSINGVAEQLEELTLSQEEIAERKKAKGEPDPTKEPADLVKEAIEQDKKKEQEQGQQQQPPAPLQDMGKPPVANPTSTSATEREKTSQPAPALSRR